MYDLILKDCKIIDEEGKISSSKDILIKDGVIHSIVEGAQDEAKEVIDCSEYYVTPGLVNLHAHSPMNLLKGIAEDVNIDDWFNKEIFPFESKITEEDVYYGALLSICEMIDNGITAFADHYFYSEKICDAIIESGIRGDVSPTIFGSAPNFSEQMENAIKLIKERNGQQGRLSVRMGPHSPYTCDMNQLESIIDKAIELNVGIHLHVSETKEQVDESIEKHGRTPFEVIYDAGGFDVPIIIGHGLWIQDEDRKFLNENSFMAISPKTYMKLSMGYGNVWKEYESLPLCIATDGAASSNTVNPIEQARIFALVGKYINNSSEDFKLEEIWKIIMRGHRALNFNSGKIKPGFAADFVVWNLNEVNTAPVYNPLAAIIYSSDSKNVLHTIVDGKFLKRDRKLLLDYKNIIKEVSNRSKEILVRGKGNTTIKF